MKWLTMAVVTLALALPVLAQDAGATRVRGVVKEVKLEQGKTDAGTLVVTVKEESMTFVVTAETIIKSGENKPKLNEIKANDKVRVDYKEEKEKKVVVKLRVENDE